MKKSLEASQAAAAKEASAQTRLLLALLDVKNKEITIRKHETMLMVKDEHIQRLWVLTTISASAPNLTIFTSSVAIMARVLTGT